MKLLSNIIGFFLLVLLSSNVYSQWKTVHIGGPMFDIINTFDGSLYAVSQNIVYKSVDSGQAWYVVLEGDYDMNSISFSSDTGYITGAFIDSKALKSIDNGESWNVIIDAPELNYTSDVWCVDGKGCFATKYFSSPASVLKTVDGFSTYTTQLLGECENFSSIYFIDKDTGYIGGWNCINSIFKTVNSGLSWNAIGVSDPETDDILKVYFASPKIGYLIYGHGEGGISKTIDYGNSWEPVYNPASLNNMWSLFFLTEENGYAIGNRFSSETSAYSGFILKTIDGGSSWMEEEITDTISSLTSITCFKNGNCFATSIDGKILSNMPIDSEIVTISKPKQVNFVLYPNPAYQELSIHGITNNANLQLITKNSLNENVDIDFDENLYADISFLPSGIYFTKIVSIDGEGIQKWVKL